VNSSLEVMAARPTAWVTIFIAPKISSAPRMAERAELPVRGAAQRYGRAEPQCRLIAGKPQLDGLARQCRGFAIKRHLGSPRRPVRRPARPPCRIAGPALGEPPAPVPRSLFPLFYLVEIRHHSISFAHPAPPSAFPERHETPTLRQF
jgi:hypothetical protein